ncbi:uncharacterized protein G2W53_018061 [Senna tora]|uniref:Uncharacterized protein n=1 Tax=Senna tora TaxID=362788 RepID=A0A834WL10_9FABA|nr:uncharacterized protein G2W53_018061 [Senna tora]
MGFLGIATCCGEFHKIHDFCGVKEKTIKVLRNGPAFEPDNRLKELIPGSQHRRGKGKCTAQRTEASTDALTKKMDFLLKGFEDHRRETHEASQFLYMNQLEIVEAWHITINTIPPLYFIEPYLVTPKDIPISSKTENRDMATPDDENEDEEIIAEDSEDF